MEIKISFKSGRSFCRMEIDQDDGSVEKKDVLNSEVMKVFQNTSTKEKMFAVPPVLRKYTPYGDLEGLLCGFQDGNNILGIFFVPGGMKYMNFSGEKMVIPFPSCIFELHASVGKLVSSKCYAVSEQTINELNEHTKLYAFPFGNVDPPDAHICWGTNFVEMADYRGMWGGIVTFYSSESNSDYVVPGQSYAAKEAYPKFLRRLSEMKKFPQKYLVASPHRKELGQILNEFFEEE